MLNHVANVFARFVLFLLLCANLCSGFCSCAVYACWNLKNIRFVRKEIPGFKKSRAFEILTQFASVLLFLLVVVPNHHY